MVAVIDEMGLEIGGARGADLREGVAEAGALQDLAEQQRLLLRVGYRTDRRHDAEVVLRDLADRGVGGRDDGDDLRQCLVGHLRPAEGLGHVDRPQPALRERVELGIGPPVGLVAFGRALAELPGEGMGDADRLGIVADDVGGGCRTGNRRRAPGGFERLGADGDVHGWLQGTGQTMGWFERAFEDLSRPPLPACGERVEPPSSGARQAEARPKRG